MNYLSITRVENGRIAKFLAFETLAEAQAHALEYGGFAVQIPNGGNIRNIKVGANNALTIEEPPARVPQFVTAYQARIALLGAGLLGNVETLMADAQTPMEAKIAWEYATQFERNSPFIAALAPGLGLTDAQIDDLFRVAETIN